MSNPWQSFSKIKIKEETKPILYRLGILDHDSDELIDDNFN